MGNTLWFCLFSIVMLRLSAAEEVKKNLSGVVGGNITLPDPLLGFGLLLVGVKNIALVNDGKLQILEEIYMNKLQWNRNSGLFTITELQKSDSGVYTIDSKKIKVFIGSYNLTVYDPAPSPAVETQTVSSDSCWLICSVDKQATLLWIKDQEIQNQNSSALSLPITVHKEDRKSSYRCVAANPAENKTLHVDVRTSCGFNSTQSADNHRSYWPLITGVTIACVLIGTLVVLRIRQSFLEKKKKKTIRQTHGRINQDWSDSCMTTVTYSNCLHEADNI